MDMGERRCTVWNPVKLCHSCVTSLDLFEERQEHDRAVERRPVAVYLYGVDVMSTKDCLHYFDGFGPTFVEWLNDSACKWRL